ncbi:MAG: C25 family cysteine peptidase [bacterium]
MKSGLMMKSALLVLVAGLAVIVPAAARGYTLDVGYGWDREQVEVRALGDYDYVGVAGSVYSGGSMGMIYEVRGLGAGEEVKGYRVLREEWEEVGSGYRLGVGVGEAMQMMDGDDAGGVEYVGSGDLFGYRVMISVVQPVRVVGGVVSVLKSVEVSVECGLGESDLWVERRSAEADRYLGQVMQGAYGRGVVSGDWDVEEYKDWVSDGPSLEGSAVDCVILTGGGLEGEFERLAGWHDRLGVRTVVRTMDWVESRYRGSDSAERVRNFLRDAYQKWGTVYVLVGGDPSIVPIRVMDYPEMLLAAGVSAMPSDQYYGNLEGTWNGDGDDRFGEIGWTDVDSIDVLPDVLVGRAPVRDPGEAGVFVDKTISYMSGGRRSAWSARAVFMAQKIESYLDGASMAEQILTRLPAGFEKVRLYENYTAYPGALPENLANVTTQLNRGAGIISHIGHGDEFRLNLGGPMMARWDIEALTSDSAFAFGYMMNCSSANPLVESAAKSFVVDPDGGCFAVLGNAQPAFAILGLGMEDDFFRLAFSAPSIRLGAASAMYRLRYAQPGGTISWWMYMNYILFGDPVVRLWAGEPESLSVTDAGTLGLEDSLYAVEVRSGGVGVEGAVVTLVGDRGEYGVGRTGSDGTVSVRYRPRGLGWVDLTVSGDGLRVYEDSVSVTGVGGHLYVSSVGVDDGVGRVGNGDGEAGWGERVGVAVGLRNGGTGLVGTVVGNLQVVAGCSLWVDVELDGARDAGKVHIGEGSTSPGGVPFGLGVRDWVFGRGLRETDESLGVWVWLDGMGWHVRASGEGGSHGYEVRLTVYGDVLGQSGNGLEAGDSVEVVGGQLVFGGGLGAGDYEDGLDIVVGASAGVTVVDGTESYGGVGSGEVVRYFDTMFDGGSGSDGVGVWFEVGMTGGAGGSWRDWVRVEVLDGELVLERVDEEDLGGGVWAVRGCVGNAGGGGLRGVEGKLRGLSGVTVLDSVSVYGDLSSGGYGCGDGYEVVETGGEVRYEFEWSDEYGRQWSDTVVVAAVSAASGLEYESGSECIELSWLGGGTGVVGYDIYRGEELAGPYELVGSVEGYSRYVDGGLASESGYHYYVRGRDAMGNVSAASETLEAWTGAPYVAGWPAVAGGFLASSVVVADLDHDGDLEVIVGCKDQKVYVWHHDGSLAAGWPRSTGDIVTACPAVANIDGDAQLEVLIGSRDGYTYAWNYDGSGVLNSNGVFKQLGGLVNTPSVDDLDGDRDFEVVATNDIGQVYVWHHNGVGWSSPNGYFAYSGYLSLSAATIVDIDGDDALEIMVTTSGAGVFAWNLDGTGVLQSSGLFAPLNSQASVVVGDLTDNGSYEVILSNTYGYQIAVLTRQGYYPAGWPQTLDNYVVATPSLACLDGDSKLDIVVCTSRKTATDSASVYVFSDAGVLRSGWPNRAAADFKGSPVVGDIDGDLQAEIVVGASDGRIFAWNKDGTRVNGWPRDLVYEFCSTPELCDLDKDGGVDVLISGSDGMVHAFDVGAPYSRGTMEWPKAHHDNYNSNLYRGPARSDVTPPDEPTEAPRELVLSCSPSPAASSVRLRLGVPSSASGRATVEVYDVRGRLVKRVLDAVTEAGYHDLEWTGSDQHNRPASSGIYFVRVSVARETVSSKIVLVR